MEAKIEPKESLTLDLHVKIHLQKACVYSLSSTWLGDVTSRLVITHLHVHGKQNHARVQEVTKKETPPK